MVIYYGEQKCSHPTCTFGGYYQTENGIRCGVHSKRCNIKTTLPKNPRKKVLAKEKTDTMLKRAIEFAENNTVIKGPVFGQLRMMKGINIDEINETYGGAWYPVFPNEKHQNRSDGYGCCSLSPKVIGPINHGQEGLPIANNLENYHQGNKVFESEVESNHVENIDSYVIKKEFYNTRIEFYTSEKAFRHKHASNGKNAPLFSIHIINGIERRFTYIQSRYFYCSQYELMTKDNTDLQKLIDMMDSGYQLVIYGYDSYGFECKDFNDQGIVKESHWRAYNDVRSPYGHEKVLHCLLTLNPEDYPWRRYYNENKSLYI